MHFGRHFLGFSKHKYNFNLIFLFSNISGECPVEHLSRLKVVIKSPSGEIIDRLDPWATYVLPTPEHFYNHHFWNPPKEQVCILNTLLYHLFQQTFAKKIAYLN